MHDVVAHSLSVMIALSDGASVVLKRDPQRAGEVLAELSATGRHALADMRRVIGVLRTGDDAPLEPQPAVDSMEKMLEGFTVAGLPLRFTQSGPPLPKDATFQLTVYRIIQESLTNVLRYGRNVTRVGVLVEREGDDVTIRVSDDGTQQGGRREGVGSAQGIRGMGERAALFDGTLAAGPAAEGGWSVVATLKIPHPAGGANARRCRHRPDHRDQDRIMNPEETAPKPRIGVLLVDDQPLLRMGFRLILEGEEDLEVLGEASDGAEGVKLALELKPDVVLMDVRMPNMDGIEATKRIAEQLFGTKVIILTTFDLDEYAFAGLQAGASAFLLKDVAPEELVNAVRLVASGDAVVAPRVTARLLETYVRNASPARGAAPAPERDPLLEDLTPRELEVLGAMSEGLSNAEIAHRFFLSEATVKTHVRRILTKLHLRDRVQAVVYAYETGLVIPSQGLDY